jgi:serine phosphatase RsbU (regulator of sigma subunit)
MARDIQRSLLPKETPAIPGWQITAVWEPARSVSGDFYDFIPFPHGQLGLVVGDVTGKGVPAALVMATTRSVLHAVTSTIPDTQRISPGEILAQVNNILCLDMPKFMFVTCLLVIIDLEKGCLAAANAGHVLPIRITAESIQELRTVGFPLCMIPDQAYESVKAQIQPGESIFFLSDGLVEAHDPHGAMFGSPRLMDQLDLVRGSVPFDGQALIDRLMVELHAFTGEGWEQEDDLTFVTLARL